MERAKKIWRLLVEKLHIYNLLQTNSELTEGEPVGALHLQKELDELVRKAQSELDCHCMFCQVCEKNFLTKNG